MKKILDKVRNLEAYAAAVLFAVIFIIVVADIVCRTFFKFSLLWSKDFIQIIVCWMLAFGMSAVVYTNDHLKIDVIINKIKPKARSIILLVMDILELAFFIMLVPYGVKTAITKMSISFTTLGCPTGYMFAALPVFGFFSAVYMLYRVITQIAGKKEGQDAE